MISSADQPVSSESGSLSTMYCPTSACIMIVGECSFNLSVKAPCVLLASIASSLKRYWPGIISVYLEFSKSAHEMRPKIFTPK